MYYKESGNTAAPLLIFIHGGGVSSWMWDNQLRHFNDYHCLALDLFGHGQSDTTAKFTIDACADAIYSLIRAKSAGKSVIVIGFSIGAQIVMELLGKYPSIADCAIINSALCSPSLGAKYWIKPAIKLTAPLARSRTFAKLQAKELYIDDQLFDVYFQDTKRMKQETLIQLLEENMAFSIPEDFKRATGKILVTVGEKEKAVMKRSARLILQKNSHARGVFFPDIKHGAPLASPALFNQMVRAWITDEGLPAELLPIN